MEKIKNFFIKLYKPTILKIVLVFIFINNTGIVQEVIDISGQQGQKREASSEKTKEEGEAELRKYVDGLYSEALKIKHTYTFENYFQDLIKIYKKRDSLNIRMDFMYADQFSRIAHFNYNSLGERTQALRLAREKYGKIADSLSGLTASEPLDKKELKAWALKLYIETFFCALIWFLIVINENQKKKNRRFYINNPFGFSLALIFYPLVFGYWIYGKIKYTYAEAEYRRTKRNVFAVFSDDETENLKNMVRKVGVKDIRSFLLTENRIFRHSFVAALAVTIFFSVIPRFAQKQTVGFFPPISELTAHLPRIDIEKKFDIEIFGKIIFSTRDKKNPGLTAGKILNKICFHFQEVIYKIIHIPIDNI